MIMSKTARPIHLVLDFDGTLTTHDTLESLAQIGYNVFPDTQTSWNFISEAYMSDYNAHASSYRPPAAKRTAIVEEITWLRSLKPIEQASATRVETAGFLRKLDEPAVRQGAHQAVDDGDVAFRSGWSDLVKRAETSILSVNFSRYFVYQTLKRATEMEQVMEIGNEAIGNVAIYANEMTGIDTQVASTIPGEALEVRTCADKLKLFNGFDASVEGAQKPLKIYVGDSPTDLECLLAADIGICIKDEPMSSGQQELANICARLAVHLKHVDEDLRTYALPDGDVRKEEDVTLWWAKDFVEINNLISRILG